MAIVNSDSGDKIFEIRYTNEEFASKLPITLTMIDTNTNYYNLEELDNIIRTMVEFRMTYDEKECRETTEECGMDTYAEDYQAEEDAAYEAERIARELERNEYI